jgi:hypothetical protein
MQVSVNICTYLLLPVRQDIMQGRAPALLQQRLLSKLLHHHGSCIYTYMHVRMCHMQCMTVRNVACWPADMTCYVTARGLHRQLECQTSMEALHSTE